MDEIEDLCLPPIILPSEDDPDIIWQLDGIYDDIPHVCDKTKSQPQTSSNSLMMRLHGDFKQLSQRNLSTSTPYVERALPQSVATSRVNDSGIAESPSYKLCSPDSEQSDCKNYVTETNSDVCESSSLPKFAGNLFDFNSGLQSCDSAYGESINSQSEQFSDIGESIHSKNEQLSDCSESINSQSEQISVFQPDSSLSHPMDIELDTSSQDFQSDTSSQSQDFQGDTSSQSKNCKSSQAALSQPNSILLHHDVPLIFRDSSQPNTDCSSPARHVDAQDTEFMLTESSQTVLSSSSQTRTCSMHSHDSNSIHSELLDSQSQSAANIKTSNYATVPLDFTESLQMVLDKCSPQVSDRLIGRKMGLESIDILSELHSRNMICTDLILQYLEPSDLCRISSVSKHWRDIVRDIPQANKRHRDYHHDRRKVPLDKENYSCKSLDKVSRGLTSGKPLGALQSVVTELPGACPEPVAVCTKHEKFLQEAKKLKNDESLRKCPRCYSPARTHEVQERAWCTHCQYDFCIKCGNAFHGCRDCALRVVKKTKTDAKVGSKKSKTNLRRL